MNGLKAASKLLLSRYRRDGADACTGADCDRLKALVIAVSEGALTGG